LTGESSDPFSTVVSNLASIAGAPLASEAVAGSVRGARGSTGCCAAAAIAQSVINIIALNTLDLVTIGSPFSSVLTWFRGFFPGRTIHEVTQNCHLDFVCFRGSSYLADAIQIDSTLG
jgi:hypothetical protein